MASARRGRVLAFVGAHPDDDVMGVAGLVALHRRDHDLRFVLVLATDGEAGAIAPDSDATPGTLGAVRRVEDRAGWDAIGRQPDRHEWLGLPDGGLADLPPGALQRPVAEVLAQERPDVVVTCGPDGVTGHPDHIAVGAATTAAFLELTDPEQPGLLRLFHGVTPQSALDRINARRVTRGLLPFDPGQPFQPRGVPDELVGCTIDQRAVVPLVIAAFRAHRSQWALPWSAFDERDWQAAAGRCHLVQAWPPPLPDAAVLTDPFEGLPADQAPPARSAPLLR